jgi:hypothetical protein
MLTASCNRDSHQSLKHIERSAYFWKSAGSMNASERRAFDSLRVTTLFVKFFDLVWDDRIDDLTPVAAIKSDSTGWPNHVSIVPVVFLTEEGMARVNPNRISDIAHKLVSKIISLVRANGITFKEIQFDCDWTERSRPQYFALIEAVRSASPGTLLSATIRLHQVKYLSRTGVPPVDRGMLMFYNMSNWRDVQTKNSILDLDKASSYTDFISRYPLPLDCVLPVFRWVLVYRNDRFLAILRDVGESELVANKALESLGDHRFKARSETNAFGIRLIPGDLLRAEAVNDRELHDAKQVCLQQIRNSSVRLALYHWDSLILSRYTYATLDSVYRP